MPNAPAASALSPARRAEALRKLENETIDVLVIGGGVVGAGAALDAASRGLSVAVVEARDWASGTSSRSSKLVHGGIRYLEQMEFKLVREALLERGRLMRTLAPHLVKPVQLLYPLTGLFERFYVGAGMTLYDFLSGRRRGVPRHRHLNPAELRQEMPGLTANRFSGGLTYYDAQVDDARLVLTLVRTAVEQGALAINRATVTEVQPAEAAGEPVERVRLRDEETGGVVTARARHVVNATGVWTDDTQAVLGAPAGLSVAMSKGVHIVVRRDRIPLGLGVLLRTEKSVLFVIPWDEHWIIGTTDTPWALDRANPAPTGADVDYLLEHVNAVLEDPLTHDDIVGVYAGLRPLVAGKASATTKLSREHVVGLPRPGVAVIAGGKLTTYRVMAQDVVDAVLASRGARVPPSRTARLPLLGAVGYGQAREACRRALRERGLQPKPADRLVDRYGDLATDVVALVDGDSRLGGIVPGTSDVLFAELAYAAREEDARHLEDVLVRRTRLTIELPDAGLAALEQIAEVVGDSLGWNDDIRKREITHYRTLVQLEHEARALLDDGAADRVLRTAPTPADSTFTSTE
ncbi:glycerol-3-phosphate dehydrogenase/oxidase [Streptomyces sp. NPDC001508]|uniref:glycerol-3-phosphate dehydrogenase/oxidase n=1 Tax=Streptomyces sp. NPDC001508 TaxID=3154656 RepID=UPI00332659B0